MRQIRLLPVVIAAGLALLLLKSVGIMTGGGYVLTGPGPAVAAGGSPAEGGAAALAVPVEPTLTDGAPTLDDGAPTLPLREQAEHGAVPPAEDESDVAADGDVAGQPDIPDLSPGDTAAAGMTLACPTGSGGEGVVFSSPDGCAPLLTEQGDAVPMVRGDAGVPVPLAEEDGLVGSEGAILERLAERRSELEAREAELDMRMALVEAAEKRIEERTAALEALEARINAMVDEKRTLEEAQFTAVVAMYETMKPKDAAAIFDELEMDVLLRVARAVNPRKMAPIMARMNPLKAKALTAGLAVDRVEPTIDMSGGDLASLPQIIGQ